ILSLFDNQGNYTCGSMASRADTRAADIILSGSTAAASGTAALSYPGFCGDGVIQSQLAETCDPPGVSGWRADCTFCGDGVVQSGGVCTTLNTTLGQSCIQNADCNDQFCSGGATALKGDQCLTNSACDSGVCSGGLVDGTPCNVRNGDTDCR